MIVDKFSVRTAVVLSGLLYTVGYLCTAFAPSLFVTALTCGVIAGRSIPFLIFLLINIYSEKKGLNNSQNLRYITT